MVATPFGGVILLHTVTTTTSFYLTPGWLPLFVLSAWHLLAFECVTPNSTIIHSFYGWVQDETYPQWDNGRAESEMKSHDLLWKNKALLGFESKGSV